MEEKISVIVPIYKVEDYLHRCVDSIINQTYTNLDIILVDDGSPDNCPMICDEYAKKDTRIRVIHKKNGGLSDARNAGLEIATGEYIGFVDSDDWIHKDMYSILYNIMMKKQCDIVECNATKIYDIINDKDINFKYRFFNYTKENAIEELISEKTIQQTVWNKLYKKELIQDIFFEKGKVHEDEFWTYQAINKCNNLIHVDLDLYYYFQRENSIMGNKYSLKRLNAIEGRYNRYLFISRNFPQFLNKAKLNLFYISIYYLQQSMKCSQKEEYKISYDFISDIIKKIEFRREDYDKFSFNDNLWIFISKISLGFCCRIRNILKLGV